MVKSIFDEALEEETKQEQTTVKSIFDEETDKGVEEEQISTKSIFDEQLEKEEKKDKPTLDLEATQPDDVDVDYAQETTNLDKKKTFQQFINDDKFLKEADLYLQARFGKDEGRQADESNKEFTKRFGLQV